MALSQAEEASFISQKVGDLDDLNMKRGVSGESNGSWETASAGSESQNDVAVIDGFWVGTRIQATIDGSSLILSDGTEIPLLEKTDRTLKLSWNGGLGTAELRDDDHLHWSNGSTWTRRPDCSTALSEYFSLEYLRGVPYQGFAYEVGLKYGRTPVLRHRATGITVWALALDVRRNKDESGRVIFHYTPEAAFTQVTEGDVQSFKSWASRYAPEDGASGFVLYGTPREPSQWADKDDILTNHYWPKSDELSDVVDHTSDLYTAIKACYEGCVDYCIPVLCDADQASDIQQSDHHNHDHHHDNHHNPPSKPASKLPHLHLRRSVWMVRIGNGNDVVQASEKVVQSMRTQIQWSQENRGPDHTETLYCIGLLAMVFLQRKSSQEAEPLLQDMLEGFPKKWGALNRRILANLRNIAVTLQRRGRLHGAEIFYRETLAGRQDFLGAQDPDTLTSMIDLVDNLKDQGRLVEAEALARQCMEIHRIRVGHGHPDTLRTIRKLALLLKELGDDEQAHELLNEALLQMHDNLDLQHSDSKGNLSMEELLKDRDEDEDAWCRCVDRKPTAVSARSDRDISEEADKSWCICGPRQPRPSEPHSGRRGWAKRGARRA